MKRLFWTILRKLSERLFVQVLFFKTFRKFLDLDAPRALHEKTQWYKLYYRNPLLTTLADKYAVREYVESRGFGGTLNEIYGVYDSVGEIDLSRLPRQFALKATHGSGMNLICKDKDKLNWAESCALIDEWLKRNYYEAGCEWAYKNIKPRLVCEKYLELEDGSEVVDYKFFCFGGEPAIVFICAGRFSQEGLRYTVYDMQWNQIRLTCKGRKYDDTDIPRPKNLDEMVGIARGLSKGLPFVRVDLYPVKGKIVFGELTFYPDNGLHPFEPDKYNYILGDLFVLPEKWSG